MNTNGGIPTRYDLRLLLCQTCGAPIEAFPQGGQVRCAYCNSIYTLAPRKERAEDFSSAAPAQPLTEEQRFEKLRSQFLSSEPHEFPPAGLRRLAMRCTDPSALPTMLKQWNEVLKRTLQGATDTDAELFWLTVFLRSQYMHQRNYVSARAVTETATEAVRAPIFRTLLHISLAGRACDGGDLQAAESWLAPIDPRPTILAVHTDLALVRSRMALMRGDWQGVFRHLGRFADEVPIAAADDVLACMLRATAHEGLGDMASAHRALWEVGRNILGKIFAPKKVRLFRDSYPNLPLCPRTCDAFLKGVTLRRTLLVLALVLVLLGALSIFVVPML